MLSKPDFRIYSDVELEALPPLSWLVQEILPEKGFCILYGESGIGKTHCALGLACAVAVGALWLGTYHTKKGSVVYIAAEGLFGLQKRLKANKKHMSATSIKDIHFLGSAVDLKDAASVEFFVTALKKENISPSLIIFDTYARCFSGDENSVKDTGSAIQQLTLIQRAFGCAILLVHHCGKNHENGMRGSSALLAAADTTIKLEGKAVGIELKCAKQKDFEKFKPIALALHTIPLENGESSVIADKQTLADILKTPLQEDTNSKILIDALQTSGTDGLTNADWLRKIRENHPAFSEKIFNNRRGELFGRQKVTRDRDGRGAKYRVTDTITKSLPLPSHSQSLPLEVTPITSTNTPPLGGGGGCDVSKQNGDEK